jgi:hypothetical protein
MVVQMSKTRFLLSRACGSSFVAYCGRMVDQMSKTRFLLSRTCGSSFVAYCARMVATIRPQKATKEEPPARDNKKRL